MTDQLWTYLILSSAMFVVGASLTGRLFNYASPIGVLYLIAAYAAASAFISSPGEIEGWKHNLVLFWIIVGLVSLTVSALKGLTARLTLTATIISLITQPIGWWLVITGV